jgi:threonine-phosphate decarboxylase
MVRIAGAASAENVCAHGGIYSVDHNLVKVDCSSSVNPLGLPPRALQAILEGAELLSSQYPDPECTELRESLSGYLDLDPGRITVGNGAIEIIHWFARAFARKRVVVPTPTFCEYEIASARAGARVDFVPLDNFRLDSDLIIRAAKNADAIFLCNPNNPTGLLATREVEEIVEGVGRHVMILLDECFIELAAEGPSISLVNRAAELDNLVILRSMTKSFAMAGLRVGYAVCNPRVAEKLKRQRVHWNVNGLAQAAGVAALSDTSYLKRARQLITKETAYLRRGISKLNSFAMLDSDANFFMVNLHRRNSTKFRDSLLRRTGVLVRDCSTFTGMDSHHVRVSVKNRKDNLALLQALEVFESRGP